MLASDPGATDPGSYPLTALSYAVTAPSTLDAAAGNDYAALLRYAVGPGQQPGTAPGQLPLGMVPLPDALIGGVAAVFTPVLTPGPHSLIATSLPPTRPRSARHRRH